MTTSDRIDRILELCDNATQRSTEIGYGLQPGPEPTARDRLLRAEREFHYTVQRVMSAEPGQRDYQAVVSAQTAIMEAHRAVVAAEAYCERAETDERRLMGVDRSPIPAPTTPMLSGHVAVRILRDAGFNITTAT